MTNLSSVGKYEVQELVGEGAMGVVYRALDPMLNRSVAVKVMNDALALDESFRTRFLREARAAGSLQHPNVITVYDCGETDGHLYIAMEYVEGTDLEQVMASRVPLTLVEKLDIVTGVLNGLAYAHKRGIVHRDMKPANIRVNDEGRALIMDFGIAHTDSSNVTKTGLVLGTPNYMAPEQVTGGGITPQTDIFSVGVVLYELLTNVKPFEGPTLHAVLFKIVGEMPEPVETLVPGIRADLSEIVMKALAKDPSERFTSAAEMANALTKISTSLSSGGTPAGSRTLSLRRSIDVALQQEQDAKKRVVTQRTWQRGAMVAAGVVVVVGLGAYFVNKSGQATPAAETPVITQQATAPIADAPSVAPAVESPAPRAQAQPVTPTPVVKNTSTAPDLKTVIAARAAAAKAAADSAARAAAQAVSVASSEPAKESSKTPVVSAPAVIPTAAAPTQPVSNPSAEIGAIVAQYARAIESRDVSELKRVYPAMSSAQSSSFDDFFKSVRSLRAALSVTSLQVDGATADAKISGAYDFVTSNGRNEHQPVTLTAALRRDGGSWRLVSIR